MEKYFDHTKLAETTKKTYTRKLESWEQLLKRPLLDILQHPKRSLEELKTQKITQTPQNWHIYLNACYSCMIHNKLPLVTAKVHETLLNEWKQLQFDNAAPLREHYVNEEPSALQKDKLVELPEVLKVRDALSDGIPKLLLSMYTMVNPERADYFETEIVTEGQKPVSSNYIDMATKKVVLTDFKTKKTYTTLTQPIPPELIRQIQLSLTESPRRYLFVNKQGLPFTRAVYSNWANRILTDVMGKRTTLTCLRHAYVSQLDFNGSLKGLTAIANSMGHSTGTQRKYKWTNELIEK